MLGKRGYGRGRKVIKNGSTDCSKIMTLGRYRPGLKVRRKGVVLIFFFLIGWVANQPYDTNAIEANNLIKVICLHIIIINNRPTFSIMYFNPIITFFSYLL